MRHPIITLYLVADQPQFKCRTSKDSRTGYVSDTARKAYNFWACSTDAGRRHTVAHGYSASFVQPPKD